MGLSRSPILPYVSSLFGGMFVFFGLTYILDPIKGYSFFGFTHVPNDWEVMKPVMVLFGAKDLFMATAIISSTWFGTRRSAGLIVLAGGLCAGVDGYVVKAQAGTGEWNHWGYGGMMVGVGAVMAGLLG